MQGLSPLTFVFGFAPCPSSFPSAPSFEFASGWFFRAFSVPLSSTRSFELASVIGVPLSLPARAFFSFELSALPSLPFFRTSFPACRLSALSSFLTV